MRYLLAISGGIDSVVLLDMLVADGGHELLVAHFDHGIRDDSAADARFVEQLAKKYGLSFVTKREELGKKASEELARDRRYVFLRGEAKKHQAQLVTAHHADDIIETIAINILRGTGWRGLAVLDAPDITRPLLQLTKQDIRTYARIKRLEWVEDSTNSETQYLRNRVRRAITSLLPLENKQGLLDLWRSQLVIKNAIEREANVLARGTEHSRYFFTQIDPPVATELLKIIIASEGVSATRPQLEHTLLAIKVARPGSSQDISEGSVITFTQRSFVVKTS
ncbi:MAG TPA: tRNA lysidine(34) synthetase TilS [Candidatus Chromulinivoraceae bacterium]|nr:tRNA lysidine(34) synthetase TilS [Candidatus Chromulinivoraceae bacterium]